MEMTVFLTTLSVFLFSVFYGFYSLKNVERCKKGLHKLTHFDDLGNVKCSRRNCGYSEKTKHSEKVV